MLSELRCEVRVRERAASVDVENLSLNGPYIQ